MTGVSTPPPPPKRASYWEIFFVVGLLAVPATANAVFQFMHPGILKGLMGFPNWTFGIQALEQIFMIAVLYILIRRGGETMADFTRPFCPGDVGWAIGLTVAMLLASAIAGAIVGGGAAPRQSENMELFRVRVTPLLAISNLVNPLCEESFMRAYLQTRLRQKGWWNPSTVLGSTAAQTAYHLYQGLPSCITLLPSFLAMAIFYQRTGRLWPVVIAHLNFDLLAMFLNAS